MPKLFSRGSRGEETGSSSPAEETAAPPAEQQGPPCRDCGNPLTVVPQPLHPIKTRGKLPGTYRALTAYECLTCNKAVAL